MSKKCNNYRGAIASLLQKEDPKDYDVFFKTKEAVKPIAEFYYNQYPRIKLGEVKKGISGSLVNKIENLETFKSVDFRGLPDEVYPIDSHFTLVNSRIIKITKNAILDKNTKVQIITAFCGLAEELHADFDFLHTTNWWEASTQTLHINEESLNSIKSKTLIYKGSTKPLAAFFRLMKFYQRGWKFFLNELLKIIFEVQNLDLSKADNLYYQLEGFSSDIINESLLRKIRDSQMNLQDLINYLHSDNYFSEDFLL